MRSAIAGFKFFLFILWCLLVVPTQILLLLVHKGNGSYILPRIWHKGVCAIFGISYEIEGRHSQDRQTLYMFNHLSYLDIPLIGGILKKSSFLAKKEVQSWPVFGFLADLQQTAYIERKRTAISKERDKIKQRVDQKQNLILFPEGTSTDGVEVRDFKSSLFSLALGQQDSDLLVQPVTLVLMSADKKAPQSTAERRIYTWPVEDNIELPAHLWRFAKSKGAHIKLVFHAPFQANEFEDRKILAKACHNSVSNGLGTLKAAA